jgi:acetyl-CoA decarbonylase/synthase complex subunit gamma
MSTDETCAVETATVEPRATSGRLDPIDTAIGRIPRVATRLYPAERLAHWRARWQLGRHDPAVPPGLYAVGAPSSRSPVLVTANYLLSFDLLRRQLARVDAWILVLDTGAMNVWCASHQGTFGTDELLRRIEATRLGEVVSHRELILPQLGASGVSATEVESRSGWRVILGPVRAADVADFIEAGMSATPQMRRVRFTLADRIALIPSELVASYRYLFGAAIFLLALSGFGPDGFVIGRMLEAGPRALAMLAVAACCGLVVAPLLLPWIPGRSFSAKGAWLGVTAVALLLYVQRGGVTAFTNMAELVAWALLVPAVSSFLSLNFTGASTFGSLASVRNEMPVAIPVQIVAALAGLVAWVAGRFIGA